jgi:outer membrane protein assembly factor BamE (lipoprotein component of BamABCDE complex)
MKFTVIIAAIAAVVTIQLSGCVSATAPKTPQGYVQSDMARLGLHENMPRSEVVNALGDPTSTTLNQKQNTRQDIYLMKKIIGGEMHVLKYQNDMLSSVSSTRR